MTTTDIIYNILSRHHELTAGAIFKKCADIKSIGNQKTVSNALIRLKKEGRVESVYDKDKGLWLWHIVRESPVASSECAMRIGDAAALANKPGIADHSEHDLEMASDVAKVEATHKESLTVAYDPGSFDDPTVNPEFFRNKHHESIVETRKSDAHENTDDASQIDITDAVLLSGKAEAQAGRASEAVEHFRDVLGIPIQARNEAKAPKPATMPVSIALAEFCSYSWKEGTTLAEVFMTGIAFAEEYHKIGPNENGDYL